MSKFSKPHVLLDSSKQKEDPSKLSFNYGFPPDDINDEIISDRVSLKKIDAFRRNRAQYSSDHREKYTLKNSSLNVPENFDYILITFESQFNTKSFHAKWYNAFGLLGVRFSKFNSEVLFVVRDNKKFSKFLSFIDRLVDDNGLMNGDFDRKVTFVKEFKLLMGSEIVKTQDFGTLLNLHVVEFPIDSDARNLVFESLTKYLDDKNIKFSFHPHSRNLELHDVKQATVAEIVENFDIISSVTSSHATVIRPTLFNVPERSYGFEISNSNDDLPIIGILDTGISSLTPLSSITIQDNSFNLTGSSSLIDNVDRGTGHGTAIGGLAALGKRPYDLNFIGQIRADARLLSMKILDDKAGYISQNGVINMLYRAKREYPAIKLFVLTICFDRCKDKNEDFSTYAFELDNFAYEHDCLIFISTANNYLLPASNLYDLSFFNGDSANLCSPAESMNNVTVGAAAHSLRPGKHLGVSFFKEYPTLYSRKGHIDLHSLYPINKINKQYFKPDVIECGGDYENDPRFGISVGSKASMQVISADPSKSFYDNIGTSFSAPLVANIAAQIQHAYPTLTSQSIKALIVNHADLTKIRFNQVYKRLINKIAGHGIVNEQDSRFSDDNQITVLIEESIEPEKILIFPIHFPEYLTHNDLGKKMGIIKVKATLCFNFSPVLDNQLAYCPIHMAFSFFKNHNVNQILAKQELVDSLLKKDLRWSQSGRFISKPIPYTNSQKISFSVNLEDLVNEASTFKLAINCRINPQLLPGLEQRYNKAHKFSIAITISEHASPGYSTGKLYNDFLLSNKVINFADLELDAQNELEINS